MKICITRFYELVSTKVGKDTAQTPTTYIEEKIKDEFVDSSKILATEEEIAITKAEIVNTNANHY